MHEGRGQAWFFPEGLLASRSLRSRSFLISCLEHTFEQIWSWPQRFCHEHWHRWLHCWLIEVKEEFTYTLVGKSIRKSPKVDFEGLWTFSPFLGYWNGLPRFRIPSGSLDISLPWCSRFDHWLGCLNLEAGNWTLLPQKASRQHPLCRVGCSVWELEAERQCFCRQQRKI